MVFGAIGKALNKAREKFEALTNENELKAVVAASVMVAAADGSISDKEKELAFSAISNHEALKGFRQVTIRSIFDDYTRLIDADFQLATEELESKLVAITDRISRIRVIGIASQIANADGEFSDSEKKVVDRIRKLTA